MTKAFDLIAAEKVMKRLLATIYENFDEYTPWQLVKELRETGKTMVDYSLVLKHWLEEDKNKTDTQAVDQTAKIYRIDSAKGVGSDDQTS